MRLSRNSRSSNPLVHGFDEEILASAVCNGQFNFPMQGLTRSHLAVRSVNEETFKFTLSQRYFKIRIKKAQRPIPLLVALSEDLETSEKKTTGYVGWSEI